MQANQAQNLGDLSLNHVAALADNLERERNVLENGFVRQQFEVLENAANVAAKIGYAPVAHGRKIFIGNINMAARRLELAGNELDEGRLARTRMANEEDELARIDLQGDIVQRRLVRLRLVDLRHMIEGDDRRTHGLGLLRVFKRK